jgi:ParB family chromosome partitioning protein
MEIRDESPLQEDSYKTIPIDQIQSDADHIRKSGTYTEGLKYTISDVGLMQPIIVRRTGDTYTVIDGHRRLKAMKELNVRELILNKEILVMTDETEADNKFRQIIANVQREDIDDIDLGYAFVTLKEEYGYYFNEIAHIIGKTPHFVTSKANLVKRLTKEVREQAILDLEAAKCNRDTLSQAHEPQYIMSTKVLEDIARLPAHLQMQAYNDITDGKRKKDDALMYLRELKQEERGVKDSALTILDYSIGGRPEPNGLDTELSVCLDRVKNDLDELEKKLRGGNTDECVRVLPTLESLLEKLHLIYYEAQGEKPLIEKVRCEASS